MNGRAGVAVRHQVEVALAEAGLGVPEAGVLLGRRPQDSWRAASLASSATLSSPRRVRVTGPPTPRDVAQVEVEQRGHRLLAQAVDARPELDAPAAVVEVEERHLALAAPRGQAPGDTGPPAPRSRRGPGPRARHARRRSPRAPRSGAGTDRPRRSGAPAPWRAAPRSVRRAHPPAGPGQPWWSPAWMSTIW